MALFRDRAVRHAGLLQQALPVLLIAAAALGYWAVTANPFNPLQLQNPATTLPQLGNIGLYYLALLPFFFLAGLYVSLCFVLTASRLPRTYAYDLTGAGAGAALALALMYVVHPFHLVPALLVPLALAAFWSPRRWVAGGIAVAVLLAGEALLLLDDQAAVQRIQGDLRAASRAGQPRRRPARDAARALHAARRFHRAARHRRLQRCRHAGAAGATEELRPLSRRQPHRRAAEAGRGAARPMRGGALDALPYALLAAPRVLLVGASGGFRIREALALGARRVVALEPDPVLMEAIRHGLGPSPALAADPRVRLLAAKPGRRSRRMPGKASTWSIISADFLDESEANPAAFSAEAIATYLRALAPGGMVSIPVSIREFPAYAVRMLDTVRAALRLAGVLDPAAERRRLSQRLERADPGRDGAVRRRAHRRPAQVLRRPLVRRVLLPRHRRGRRRAPTSTTTCRRSPSRPGSVASGDGNDDAVADEAGAALRRRADGERARLQPRADHARPAVLLLGAAARPARPDPEAAGNPAAGGDRPARQSRRAAAGGAARAVRAAGAARRPAHRRRARGAAAGRSCGRCSISPRSASASCSSRSS